MRNIGIQVNQPKKGCDDHYCPFHGNLSVRGKIITGKVSSIKMKSSITVEKTYLHYLPKYMRYEKRRNKILAHNPHCIKLEVGDTVTIAECRPISKNISFVVIEKKE